MEWNVKTPLQWDLENLMMLNASTTEIPRKLRSTEWEIDGGMDSGSLYAFGAGSSGGSGSDLGLASLSKSSKSASINSSSLGEVNGNKFTLEGFEGIPNDIGHKKDFAKVERTGTSPVEASVGSGEPLLGLKLGKRTYFEDVCAGNNARSSSSAMPASSVIPAKRSKASGQSTNALHCQVEGCNLDLSSAKDYHRKHRVCENHSKSPKVIVGGLERRFCQQCSRFHGLSEFDEKKRSCRRRLSDHNARRRKPQTEPVTFNAARLSASPYGGKHEISFVWNRVPFIPTRPVENFAWEGTFGSKPTQTKVYTNPKVGSINGELQLPGNDVLNPLAKRNNGSYGSLLPKAKCSAVVLDQDVEESTMSTNMGMTQDLHRALSLLSTDSWDSCEPKQGSLDYSMHANNTNISQPMMHTISQGFPVSLSENWQIEQQSTASQTTFHGDGDNHFQEFQLLRSPYDSGFYSNRIS
ncbi:hypothetical protein SLEP1_g26816 [Rubroshorea leprosula]|uniref:SBP-type domain-containing protein n=2 Tax=Rubroshorea leprosula TaxID=152421 RepID=A0AAV5JTU7_9ROSI|nr:hypothetical protein SLEP1_g26816 [Rubroshorea leprosula]